MSCVQRIQPYLSSKESCKYCIDGCLVNGWTRLPHFFAIVRSTVNNYGLIIFSYPGIGSKDITIYPKYALPIDVNFKYIQTQSTNNHFSSEIQLELISGSLKYLAEFVIGSLTQEFISVLREVCAVTRNINSSFEWLSKYNNKSNSSNVESSEDWPWSQITHLPSNSVYTPIAFDADDDIVSFDPYAPVKANPGQVRSAGDDLLGDYENIEVVAQNMNINIHQEHQSSEVSLEEFPTNDFDLNDFDSLSKEEIEEGIKAEKILSSSLKRSGNVVTNRTWSHSSAMLRSDQKETDDQNDGFDVVDHNEVQFTKFYSNSTANNPVTGIKEDIKLKCMKERENEFTDLFPLSIYVGTWNVNGLEPTESLVPWLQPANESLIPCLQSSNEPDIFAIGFQELDLSAECFVFGDKTREDQWVKYVESALPKGYYFQIKLVRLIGMMLVVYAHVKHKDQIKDIDSGILETGILGMLGNKGGVGIRFQLHETSICFVNSHLAAHMSETERRNQDFNKIHNNLKFTFFQNAFHINQHNMVFWLGDLNYRFEEKNTDQIKKMIEAGDYINLLKYDQLHRQQIIGNCFQDFTELKPMFKPTYKFDPGTDNWDTSEKARTPAWCDRILWKGKHIEQLSYLCHPQLKLSDHKPVSAFFKVNIKVVDKIKERKVLEDIVRKLDKEENESLPQVKLEKQEVLFGDVDFMEKKVGSLPIANIGQHNVRFSFIAKLDEQICKPWFKINPLQGEIMAGDIIEIELTLYVDEESAPMVSKDNYQLNDILVLHLDKGKDFFVPLSAAYKTSVFGTSLETLVRTYSAIRDVPIDSLIKLESIASSASAFPDSIEPLEIPKELWLLIDHLHKFGMMTENILLKGGIDSEIMEIRTHLDTGVHEGSIPGSIYSIGKALLLFLKALPEPVIPYSYHEKCIEGCNNFILCKQAIQNLPSCHFNVFRYLCAFLRELVNQNEMNKLDAKSLADEFGPIFLRSQTGKTDKTLKQKKAKFVRQFLDNDFRC